MVTYHEGTYYLYYLISERFVCDGFALATSQDGVHWQDHGWVLRPSAQMVRYLGLGSIWKDVPFAETGRFLCNYSEWRMDGDKNVQSLFFAWSKDLTHWHGFGQDRAFEIDERFYRRIEPNAQGPWEDPRWDGMCVVPRAGGGYYGYWTATPREFLGFGFGLSADGLHWQALQPPSIEWGDTPRLYFIEVGGVHEIDGKYYAMLADYASVHCGMFSFVADSPGGPFRPSPRDFDLLRNQSKMHAYFTRFFDSPDGVLVNHHTLAEGQFSDPSFVVYYAPLKKAQLIDGTLYLAWWQGNDRLRETEIHPGPPQEPVRFDPSRGLLLEGELALPGTLIVQNEGGRATGIRVDEQGITEIGPIQADGTGFQGEERVDREIAFGASPHIRLLLHRTMLELYLDDIFIQCYTLPTLCTGTIACQGLGHPTLWQWEPTAPS